MRRHLRVLFVSLLLTAAVLVLAAVVLFRAEHLSFYSPLQAQAKFGVSPRDLALVQASKPSYIWVIPRGGDILSGLHQSKILIGLVYVPALLIMLLEIRRLAKHHRYEISQTVRGQSL